MRYAHLSPTSLSEAMAVLDRPYEGVAKRAVKKLADDMVAAVSHTTV